MATPFGERSTGEIIVLVIAVSVCFVVVFGVIAIAIVEVIDSETDTIGAAAVISDVVNTLIGVMAGFLAGRTEGAATTQDTSS